MKWDVETKSTLNNFAYPVWYDKVTVNMHGVGFVLKRMKGNIFEFQKSFPFPFSIIFDYISGRYSCWCHCCVFFSMNIKREADEQNVI